MKGKKKINFKKKKRKNLHNKQEILQKEDDLSEIVAILGREGLTDKDQVTLAVAKIVREAFLQQNPFTPYDRYAIIFEPKRETRNAKRETRNANFEFFEFPSYSSFILTNVIDIVHCTKLFGCSATLLHFII